MKNYDILISVYRGIRLEYRITPDGITVSGRNPDGRRETATVILHKGKEKRRKLEAMFLRLFSFSTTF